MNYDLLNVESPYFWILWCGLFLGASVSRVIRPAGRVDRYTAAALYLTASVAAAACALVVPRLSGVEPHIHLEHGIFLAASITAGLVGMRFKRAAGIPVLVAAAAIVAICGYGARGFVPISSGETIAARFRVLSTSQGKMTVEVDAAGVPAVVETLDGQLVAPAVSVILFHEAYFFLRSPGFYRFERIGVTADDRSRPKATEPVNLPLPGVRQRLLVASPVRPSLLQSYSIVLYSGSTLASVPTERVQLP